VGQGEAPISTREQVETNWRDGWRAFFKPLVLSTRFGVHPPWTEPLEVPHAISIDPGMAFGTGSHATTRGVMQALDDLLAARAPISVLDVGTGSGILAIAAAKLGHRVLGVEIDETALQNARENVEANGAEVDLQVGSSADVEGRFDLVIANIIAPILIDIARPTMARVAPTGDLLLSGVLDWQVDDVLAAYAPFTLVARTVVEGADSPWTVLHLRP
jgi:ribosomal protein L11 methyltransferase